MITNDQYAALRQLTDRLITVYGVLRRQRARADAVVGDIDRLCDTAVRAMEVAGVAYLLGGRDESIEDDTLGFAERIAMANAVVATAWVDLLNGVEALGQERLVASEWEAGKAIIAALLAIGEAERAARVLAQGAASVAGPVAAGLKEGAVDYAQVARLEQWAEVFPDDKAARMLVADVYALWYERDASSGRLESAEHNLVQLERWAPARAKRIRESKAREEQTERERLQREQWEQERLRQEAEKHARAEQARQQAAFEEKKKRDDVLTGTRRLQGERQYQRALAFVDSWLRNHEDDLEMRALCQAVALEWLEVTGREHEQWGRIWCSKEGYKYDDDNFSHMPKIIRETKYYIEEYYLPGADHRDHRLVDYVTYVSLKAAKETASIKEWLNST